MRHVVAVQPIDSYQILITFDGGEQKIYDMKPWLNKPYFQQLKDINFFNTAHVDSITKTVTWDGGRELCPDMLFEDGIPVANSHT